MHGVVDLGCAGCRARGAGQGGGAPRHEPAGRADGVVDRRDRGELPGRRDRPVLRGAGGDRPLGRPGAGRASSSRRCWRRWPASTPAGSCSPRSTSTPTRGSRRPSRCSPSRPWSRVHQGSAGAAVPGRAARAGGAAGASTSCSGGGGERARRRGRGPGRTSRGGGAGRRCPRFDAAFDAIERGDWDAAEAAYQAVLAESRPTRRRRPGLGQVGAAAAHRGRGPGRGPRARPTPSRTRSPAQPLAADVELLTGRVDQAFDRLVELVRRTAGAERSRGPRPPRGAVRPGRRRRPPGRQRPYRAGQRPVLTPRRSRRHVLTVDWARRLHRPGTVTCGAGRSQSAPSGGTRSGRRGRPAVPGLVRRRRPRRGCRRRSRRTPARRC